MRLDRLTYDPAALVDFYEEGFAALGALCERTWHDRLEIVAEGQAAPAVEPGRRACTKSNLRLPPPTPRPRATPCAKSFPVAR